MVSPVEIFCSNSLDDRHARRESPLGDRQTLDPERVVCHLNVVTDKARSGASLPAA